LGYAASLSRVLEKEKNSIRHRLSGTALLPFLLPLKEAVSPYNGVTKAQPEPCHEIKQKCRRTPARVFVTLASIPMAAVLLVAMFTVHLPYGFSSIKLQAVTAAGAQFGSAGV